ncbi:hypothetical protein ACQKWADRAFT_307964 [Trichoderma austrokoningii]
MRLPFEGPSPIDNWSLYCEWSENVGPEMRSPELLWVKYWEQFNTVKIPVLQDRAFFDTALQIAKLSKDKEEFERRFEEHNSKRKEKIIGLMKKASTNALFEHKFKEMACPDALNKAGYACVTGCLQHFLQVTKGIIYGWEAKEVFDNTPKPCKNCGLTQLLSCKLCKSKVDFCGECGKQPDGCLSCSTQYFGDDSNDGTFRAVNLFPFSTEHNRALEEESSSEEESIPRKRDADNATGSLTEEPQTFYQRDSMSPEYDDYVDALEYQEPTSTSIATSIINAPAGILVKANKGQATPRKQKRVSFSNVDDIRHFQKESANPPTSHDVSKRSRYNHTQKIPKYLTTSFYGLDELNALIAAESASGSSSPESESVNPPASHGASGKRSRYDDDDGDDDNDDTNNHAQKRQKHTDYSFYGQDELNALDAAESAQGLSSPEAKSSPEAESVKPPSSPAASHDASRKRSRYDDDDDHDDVDSHTQKRQKTETPAAYSPISRASSPTHQDANINQRRRERSQSLKTSHSPRPVNNTRSLRTQRQPEFWELDGLGQPRSL